MDKKPLSEAEIKKKYTPQDDNEFIWKELENLYDMLVTQGLDEMIAENTTEETLKELIASLVENTKRISVDEVVRRNKQYADKLPEVEKELDEENDYDDKISRNFDNCYIIEGIPLTTKAKSGKLENIIKKRIVELCKVEATDLISFHIPFDENEKSLGFCFFELNEKKEPKDVIKALHMKPMIKRMTKYMFKCQRYSSIDKYVKHAEDFQKPFVKEKFRGEAQIDQYLCDKHAREMYIVRERNEASVSYFDPEKNRVEKTKVFRGGYFAEDELRWSPKGTYVVAYNPTKKDFELYGGLGFDLVKTVKVRNEVIGVREKLDQMGSQSFTFSPQENFFCVKQASKKMEYYLVYDVRSCNLRKKFTKEKNDNKSWNFKWSCSDKFLACSTKDKIELYDTKTFEMTKVIREKGIVDFEWSPIDNILVYFTRQVIKSKITKKKNTLKKEKIRSKGNLSVIRVPSMQVLKAKSYHDIESLKLNWQNTGEFFALLSETKTLKGGTYEEVEEFKTNVDLFHVTRKGSSIDVSVGTIVVPEKIDKFHWEPLGNKFAFVSVENKKEEDLEHVSKNNLTLYKMEKGQAEKIKYFNLQSTDTVFIHWSPAGKYFVLVEMKFTKTRLEFWNTEPCEEIGFGDHFITGHTEWDPSGRYFMASTTRNKSQDNNGFVIYQLGGKVLYNEKIQKLWEVKWRVRPPELLSPSQKNKLKRLIQTKYAKKFAKEEKEREKAQKKESERRLRKVWDEYQKCRRDGKKHAEKEGQGSVDVEEYEVFEETYEEVIEETIDENV